MLLVDVLREAERVPAEGLLAQDAPRFVGRKFLEEVPQVLNRLGLLSCVLGLLVWNETIKLYIFVSTLLSIDLLLGWEVLLTLGNAFTHRNMQSPRASRSNISNFVRKTSFILIEIVNKCCKWRACCSGLKSYVVVIKLTYKVSFWSSLTCPLPSSWQLTLSTTCQVDKSRAVYDTYPHFLFLYCLLVLIRNFHSCSRCYFETNLHLLELKNACGDVSYDGFLLTNEK